MGIKMKTNLSFVHHIGNVSNSQTSEDIHKNDIANKYQENKK